MTTKQDFLDSLTQTYQENIWKDEMNLMELDERLGEKRTDLASIDLKLERKEFPSANEGKKALEQTKSDIAEIEALITETKGKMVLWTKQINLIKRYAAL